MENFFRGKMLLLQQNEWKTVLHKDTFRKKWIEVKMNWIWVEISKKIRKFKDSLNWKWNSEVFEVMHQLKINLELKSWRFVTLKRFYCDFLSLKDTILPLNVPKHSKLCNKARRLWFKAYFEWKLINQSLLWMKNNESKPTLNQNFKINRKSNKNFQNSQLNCFY